MCLGLLLLLTICWYFPVLRARSHHVGYHSSPIVCYLLAKPHVSSRLLPHTSTSNWSDVCDELHMRWFIPRFRLRFNVISAVVRTDMASPHMMPWQLLPNSNQLLRGAKTELDGAAAGEQGGRVSWKSGAQTGQQTQHKPHLQCAPSAQKVGLTTTFQKKTKV